MVRKLSMQQLRMLRNVYLGDSPGAHTRSMSEAGGAATTFSSLIRAKLLTVDGALTDAGRAAIEAAPGGR